MRRINHPNVRVNFDTGNITYYNAGADVVAELKKVIDYVATVELKDHGGRPKTWDFPALGQGKIDFAGVLRVLKEHGYSGPITIEVEGVEGDALGRRPDQASHRRLGGLPPQARPIPMRAAGAAARRRDHETRDQEEDGPMDSSGWHVPSSRPSSGDCSAG